MKTVKKLADMLAATDEATLDKIVEFEREGKFNDHLDSGVGQYVPVDENFIYLNKNPFKRLGDFFKRLTVVRPFNRYTNKLFKTQVTGRENARALNKKGCIVCCNHVNKLDCMAITYALKGKRVYTTGAEFNNMEGFLGDMMRVGRLLPFSSNYAAMKNFDAALSEILKRGDAVTFFPERAEWWGYEKPRPPLPGACKYAVKNNVPVLPLFITFYPAESGKRTDLKRFVVNILPPLFPEGDLSAREAANDLNERLYDSWKSCYESFYGAAL